MTMDHSRRYVRKLRITSGDRNSAKRCLTKMEDAFNTASIPGLPHNGILYVRHFDLGTFSATWSSTTLSLLIEDKIRNLSSEAVRVDEQEHPNASVVWFSDPVQPYIILAGLIAEGKTPSAWYWRCAVPEWKPEMTKSQALMFLTAGAMQTPAGTLAAARLMDSLLESNRLDRYLEHFTPQNAISLLHEAGIRLYQLENRQTSLTAPLSPTQLLNPTWQRSIIKWVKIWGMQDARTLLLVYLAILNRNPAMAESPDVLIAVRQVAGILKEPENINPATDGDLAIEAANLLKPNALDNSMKEGVELFAPLEVVYPDDEGSRQSGITEKKIQSKKESDRSDHTAPTNKTTRFGVSDQKQPEQQTHSKAGQSFNDAALLHKEIVARERLLLTGALSRFAGLILLIPLLNFLNIKDILKRYTRFVYSNFPARILKMVANRFRIPLEDPVYQFIPEFVEIEDSRVLHFVAPDFWEGLVFSPEVQKRALIRYQVADLKQRWLLTDETRSIILALGTATQLELLPDWLKKCTFEKVKEVQSHPDLDSLADTFIIMAERYLRRFAGFGLRTLVKRMGVIATTRTHVDVVFDLRYADVRIRSIGLDIDPGWVAWFGRIIQFHYVENES